MEEIRAYCKANNFIKKFLCVITYENGIKTKRENPNSFISFSFSHFIYKLERQGYLFILENQCLGQRKHHVFIILLYIIMVICTLKRIKIWCLKCMKEFGFGRLYLPLVVSEV